MTNVLLFTAVALAYYLIEKPFVVPILAYLGLVNVFVSAIAVLRPGPKGDAPDGEPSSKQNTVGSSSKPVGGE